MSESNREGLFRGLFSRYAYVVETQLVQTVVWLEFVDARRIKN